MSVIRLNAPLSAEEIRSLRAGRPNLLAGFRDGAAELIEPARIMRIYAASQRVYCVTETGEYTLRLRLYEVEERLDKQIFMRISHSEIVNLTQVRRFDLSLAGTVCAVFKDGSKTYAESHDEGDSHWSGGNAAGVKCHGKEIFRDQECQ